MELDFIYVSMPEEKYLIKILYRLKMLLVPNNFAQCIEWNKKRLMLDYR